MNDRRGKEHISRILVRSNWKHTRMAIFVLAVLFVLLFAVGIIAGNEFLRSSKVILCMALFLMGCTVSLVSAYYIRTRKRKLLAVPFYILFWAVYEILFIVAAQEARDFFTLYLVAAVLAVSLCAFPVFSYYSAAVFYSGQFFVFLKIVMSTGYSVEQGIYLFTPVILCCAVSFLRYYLESKHISDRLALENFIEESETDALTGLLNRRGLARNIEAIWPYCQRENCRISVIMLDIDYFKLYNDTFGHPQGDVCIRKIGEAILSCLRRRTDFAARVGGEEFLVVMPGMGDDTAIEWADYLKNSIAELGIRHAYNSPFANVTVSIGVMSYDVCKNTSFEEMKSQVDACLYMAKDMGRNCICANGKFYSVPRKNHFSGQRVI